MFSKVKSLLQSGWGVITEAHTALWLLGGLGLPAAVPAWLGWDNADARPWLVTVGIFIWAILFFLALLYLGHGQLPTSAAATLSETASKALGIEQAHPTKPAYSAREKEDRYVAWSRIYKVLNTDCSHALDKGGALYSTWKNSIINYTPMGYVEKLREFQRETSNALQEINSIYREYEYLTDIKGYFENSWGGFQKLLGESTNIFIDKVKRIPEGSNHNVIGLIETEAENFNKGVGGFGEWITKAKIHAANEINYLR